MRYSLATLCIATIAIGIWIGFIVNYHTVAFALGLCICGLSIAIRSSIHPSTGFRWLGFGIICCIAWLPMAYARLVDPTTAVEPKDFARPTGITINACFISVFTLLQCGFLILFNGLMARKSPLPEWGEWSKRFRHSFYVLFLLQVILLWMPIMLIIYWVMVSVFGIWIDL